MNQINTYVDEEGKLHFVNFAGADTVLNFSNISDLGILSALTQSNVSSRDSTFDLSIYPNYKAITKDNIIFMPLEWTNYGATDVSMLGFQYPLIKNYNETTGIVTIQGASGVNYIWGASISKAHFIILK